MNGTPSLELDNMLSAWWCQVTRQPPQFQPRPKQEAMQLQKKADDIAQVLNSSLRFGWKKSAGTTHALQPYTALYALALHRAAAVSFWTQGVRKACAENAMPVMTSLTQSPGGRQGHAQRLVKLCMAGLPSLTSGPSCADSAGRIRPSCHVLDAEGAAAQGPGCQAQGGAVRCTDRQACSCCLGGQLRPVPVRPEGLCSDTRL